MSLRLVQFFDEAGTRRVGVPSEDGRHLTVLNGTQSVYSLVLDALAANTPLATFVRSRLSDRSVDYDAVIADRRLLPPIDHPDETRCHVTGTGLTHLGSADTRDNH